MDFDAIAILIAHLLFIHLYLYFIFLQNQSGAINNGSHKQQLLTKDLNLWDDDGEGLNYMHKAV